MVFSFTSDGVIMVEKRGGEMRELILVVIERRAEEIGGE